MSRLRNIDISLLRAFVAVADHGSISNAARRLHITQGGLSHQIRRLEVFFGCLLLARDPRGSQLTESGLALLPQARKLLAFNDSLCGEMQGMAGQARVRVGVPYDMAGAHFAPVLKAYARHYPDVTVDIVGGSSVDLLRDFTQGRLDVMLNQCPAAVSRGERLAVDNLVWVGGSQALWRQRPLTLCFVTPTCIFRDTVFPLLRQADIGWKVIFENASVEATLATVRSDLALTPWLRSLVPDDLHELTSDCGLPALPEFAVELYIAPAADREAAAMADMIRGHYAKYGMRRA